ncbi:ankyrin repeat-containing domain protein [Annulohypoxylon nitens]|nr:ankyrin repeat-containing domain protein [Annulohypoxylon nitens]
MNLGVECELAVEELLILGYKPDALSLNAAIQHRLPPNLIKRLAQECTDINATDTSRAGETHPPLLAAAVVGDLDSVRVLIDIGVDPNAGSQYDQNYALYFLIKDRRLDILDFMLESGLNRIYTPPINDYSTLGYAASLGYLDIMHYLLDRGVDVNSHRASVDGVTALEAAASAGRLDAVKLLLESGAITNGRGQIQYISAVCHATKMGYSAIVELLKSHRLWKTTDWHILRWLEGQDRRNLTYVYHDQCTGEYVTELLKFRDREEIVVTVGPYATIQTMEKDEITGDITETVISLETRCAIMTVKNRSLADRCQNWLLIPDSPQNATDVPIHLSQYQISWPDATIVSDVQPEENIETLFDIPDTDSSSGDAEDPPININLETHDEVEVDEEMRQHILDDMLGVREAPIEPIEWSW